eukprot:2791695-Alexandrium_andersonii.AAC.1
MGTSSASPGTAGSRRSRSASWTIARLDHFRSDVITAYKKSEGLRDNAPAVAAKKVRISTIVDSIADVE